MRAVMKYTMQEKKTLWEGRQLVSGVNCDPQTAYDDFILTKELYHKPDGKLFHHMVQSFPKGETVDPVTAHAAALKLAEYYKGYEVLVCTHVDREHIHSHLVVNSVSFETGRKLHIGSEELQELRQCNDAVCLEFSLPVFQEGTTQKKSKTMTTGEYHTAARGQSKKLQLMNIINDCMRHASSREEFIALMESEGCKVRWEKSRKNITYTLPDGWRCRDRLLFGDKYLKETMEHEFAIRQELIHGRTAGQEPSAPDEVVHAADTLHRDPLSRAGCDGGTAEQSGAAGAAEFVADEPTARTHRASDELGDADTGGRTSEGGEAAGADGRTGWEAEREAFFSAQAQTAQTVSAAPGMAVGGRAVVGGGNSGIASALVQVGRRLEHSQSADPVRDSTTMHYHADSKTLRREREKKIAQGHAADDHEEEQIYTWQQTM